MPRSFLIKKKVKCKSPPRMYPPGTGSISPIAHRDWIKVELSNHSPGQVSEDSGIEELGDVLSSPEQIRCGEVSGPGRRRWEEGPTRSFSSHEEIRNVSVTACLKRLPQAPGSQPQAPSRLPSRLHQLQQLDVLSERLSHNSYREKEIAPEIEKRPLGVASYRLLERPLHQVQNRLEDRFPPFQHKFQGRPIFYQDEDCTKKDQENRSILLEKDNEENKYRHSSPQNIVKPDKEEVDIRRPFLPYGYPHVYSEAGVTRERSVLRYAPYHLPLPQARKEVIPHSPAPVCPPPHALGSPHRDLYRREGSGAGSPSQEICRDNLHVQNDVSPVQIPQQVSPLSSHDLIKVAPLITYPEREGLTRSPPSEDNAVSKSFWEVENMPQGVSMKAESRRLRHEAPRFQCEDCNKSYATFSGLTKHKQFHCSAQIKKEFRCKHCDRPYVSLGALKMHIRTHTLPCKCHICGKAFSRPWLLQGHIRTHTGEKPFSCEHCSRAFADRSNLRAHLQTHSEIKKYNCKVCSKTFSRMSLLTKHEEGGCCTVY